MVKRVVLAEDPPVDDGSGSFVFELGPEVFEDEEVILTMEAATIAAIEAFTPLSVQTAAQAEAVTNKNARLLYSSATRTQGNFSLFYAQALRDLARDLVRFNILLTDYDKVLACAYLVWHYGIKKFPDWETQSVSSGGESVNRGKAGVTSAWAAYMGLLKGSKKANQSTPKIGTMDDYANYDDRLKPANIEQEQLAGDE